MLESVKCPYAQKCSQFMMTNCDGRKNDYCQWIPKESKGKEIKVKGDEDAI